MSKCPASREAIWEIERDGGEKDCPLCGGPAEAHRARPEQDRRPGELVAEIIRDFRKDPELRRAEGRVRRLDRIEEMTRDQDS